MSSHSSPGSSTPSPQLSGRGAVVVVVGAVVVVVVLEEPAIGLLVVVVIVVVVVGMGSQRPVPQCSPASQPLPSQASPRPGSTRPSPQPVETCAATLVLGVFFALKLPVNPRQSVPSLPISFTCLRF